MNNFLRFLNPSILSKMTGAMLILLLHLLVLQKSNSWNNLLVYVVLPKLLPTCPYLRFVIMLKRKTVSYGLVHTLLHRYIIYIPNNYVLYVPILIAFMIAYISFTAKIILVRPWNLWRHEKILQCSTHGFYDIKEKLGTLYNSYTNQI